MKNNTRHIFFYFCVVTILVCTPAYAFDLNAGVTATDYLYLENNFLDPVLGLYNQEDTYNLLSIQPYLAFSHGSAFSGYLLGDISWTHYMDDETDDDLEAEFLNAFFTLSGKTASAHIGLQPFQFGRGFIFFNDEPGMALEHTFSREYYMRAEVAATMDSSTIAALTFGYKRSFLESIEVFGAWYRDGDDKLAELLNTITEISASDSTVIKSEGDFFWMGGGGDLFIGPFYVSGCVIYETARPTITFETLYQRSGSIMRAYTDRSVTVSSGLLDFQIDYTFTPNTSAGLILFYTPGDLSPSAGEITTFLSPIPFNTRNAIFFSNFGMIDGSDEIALVGTQWSGVIAPGINLDFKPLRKMTVDSTLMFLYPEETQAGGQSMYGWEVDTLFSYDLMENLKFFFEADVFQYGEYYRTQEGDIPKAATRILGGISGYF